MVCISSVSIHYLSNISLPVATERFAATVPNLFVTVVVSDKVKKNAFTTLPRNVVDQIKLQEHASGSHNIGRD
jgi:hypothetical protein